MMTDVQTRYPNNAGHNQGSSQEGGRGAATHTILAGIGGIAFAVLNFVTFALVQGPGGDYKASDAVRYIAPGNRAAVFVSVYLVAIGAVGLVCLFAHLREDIVAAGGRPVHASVLWGAGVAVAIAFLLGRTIALSVPIAYAVSNGGGFSIAPTVTYAIVQIGNTLVFGAGGIVMGLTLIGLFVVARHALPTWLRWVTLVAGILGLASVGFFPFFGLLLWALVIGTWLVVSRG